MMYFFIYSTSIFRTKTDIPRIFLEHVCIFFFGGGVNVTIYDVVNIIHDVITTPNLFPYTAKFMFVGVRYNETEQIRLRKINRIRT